MAADSVGAVVHSLVVGIAVQSLIAPDALPSAEQAAAALRELAVAGTA